MKKLAVILFVLTIYSSSAFAQFEIKTRPLKFLTHSGDLYVETIIKKRVGVEVGIGWLNNTLWSNWYFANEKKKGHEALVAAKFYFLKELYMGLYARPRKVHFTNESGIKLGVPEEHTIGLGVMAGYKVVGKKGFLFEFSVGLHNDKLIKGEIYERVNNRGGIIRAMVGYQFSWKKETKKIQ